MALTTALFGTTGVKVNCDFFADAPITRVVAISWQFKLFTMLYLILQSSKNCIIWSPDVVEKAPDNSGMAMTARMTPRPKPMTRRTTAVKKRRVLKSIPKSGEPQLTKADVIASSLEADIVLGRRHPRERLIEQDICEQFNTHRADVRLAFFELEKKGIIQRIPNRGAIVRDLSPKEVTEIYAVREEMEVMAARILQFPIAQSDIDKLDEIQRKHSAAIDIEDLLTVFYSNLYFHRTLYELCRNRCLIDTIEQLAQKVYGIRSYANAFPNTLDRARRDHIGMIAALRTSNRDELIALTRRHLEPSPEAYIRAYRTRFGDPGVEVKA